MSFFKACKDCVKAAQKFIEVGDTIEIVEPDYCQNGRHGDLPYGPLTSPATVPPAFKEFGRDMAYVGQPHPHLHGTLLILPFDKGTEPEAEELAEALASGDTEKIEQVVTGTYYVVTGSTKDILAILRGQAER